MAKSKTKNSSQKSAPKKRAVEGEKVNGSKLISIRIPENMIDDLRQVANEKGGGGYQQLIKSYIADGLQDEPQALAALCETKKTSAPKTAGPVSKSGMQELTTSKVIAEDIKSLAKALKPYYTQFSGKTFLVTGAFGFLGRYIVFLFKYLNQERLLEKPLKAILLDNFVTGYEQQVISDENLIFRRADVIQPVKIEQPVDYIIHAAGIASPVYYTKFPIETMDVGTVGTRHMLELAREKSVKSFIFMSSSEVYGDPDSAHVPTTEDYNGNVSVLGPRSCYDESKRFGETMCKAFYQVYGVPVKMIRPFNVYGPGIRPDDYRVLPNFIEHALRKEPLPIHGPGHNTRSFCYIVDAIESIFRVLFCDADGEAFNIGNPEPEISVKELAKMVVKEMPFKVDIVHIDAPHAVYASSDPKRRCPDISKLTRITGYEPKFSLKEGLRRTIKWFSTREI